MSIQSNINSAITSIGILSKLGDKNYKPDKGKEEIPDEQAKDSMIEESAVVEESSSVKDQAATKESNVKDDPKFDEKKYYIAARKKMNEINGRSKIAKGYKEFGITTYDDWGAID